MNKYSIIVIENLAHSAMYKNTIRTVYRSKGLLGTMLVTTWTKLCGYQVTVIKNS